MKVSFNLKTFLLASLIFFFTSTSVIASPVIDSDLEAFFDQTMKEQMEKYNIPNATLAIVSDGDVVLTKGYGFADLEKKVAVNPNTTVFRIGSTSKLFTWTAVMQLVEEGKIDLDADINNYLDFRIPGSTPITMRHLLTHTPGFEDVMTGLFLLETEKMLPLKEYLRQYLPTRVFPAGEFVAYSNYGTALAGYIVERVSGEEFSKYIEENVYRPLNMKNSTFKQPLPRDLALNMTKAYRFSNEQFHEGGFELLPGPAGSMSTTASDMSKFMLAHLQGGSFNDNKILKEETIEQMHSKQFTHHPLLDGMAFGFIEYTINGQRALVHGGNTMLFDSGLYLLPEKNFGLFLAYSGGNYLLHTEVFQKFMNQYYPEASTSSQKEEQVKNPESAKARTQHFLGEYHMNRRSFSTSDSALSLMKGVIQVKLDEEGYLLVTHYGESNRFIEVEPGVYRNLRQGRSQDPVGAFKTIVFTPDASGNLMLAADGPMSYSKAPWWATAQFNVLTLLLSLITILGSLLYWVIRFIVNLFRKNTPDNPKDSLMAQLTALTFSLLTFLFLLGLISTMEIAPAYGVPLSVFGIVPAWTLLTDQIPIVLLLLAIPLVIYNLLVWQKNYWSKFSRIHYSLFTVAALALIWILNYWNFIF